MKRNFTMLLLLIVCMAGCLEKDSGSDDDNGIVWKVKDIVSEEIIDANVKIDSPYITDSSTDNMVELSKPEYFLKIGVVPLKYGQKNLIGYLAPDFTKKAKYKLSGTIKDGDTNGVISEAYVSVCGKFISKKSSTDINGFFEITDIPEGEIEVGVYKDGYTGKIVKLKMSTDINNMDKMITKDSTKKYGDIIGTITGYKQDVCGYSYITLGISGSEVYKTTFSDYNGNYAIYGIPYADYIISCKTPGFYKINSGTTKVEASVNTNNLTMSIITGA